MAVTAPPGSTAWVTGTRKAPSRWRQSLIGLLLASPPFLLMLLLIVVPTVQAFLYSVGQVPTDNIVFQADIDLVSSAGPTFLVYSRLLASVFFQADLQLTLFVTFVSVFLVLLIGYVLSLYVRFAKGRLPAIVRMLYLIPLFIPVVIASYALIEFYVNSGFLQVILEHLGIHHYASPVYAPDVEGALEPALRHARAALLVG